MLRNLKIITPLLILSAIFAIFVADLVRNDSEQGQSDSVAYQRVGSLNLQIDSESGVVQVVNSDGIGKANRSLFVSEVFASGDVVNGQLELLSVVVPPSGATSPGGIFPITATFQNNGASLSELLFAVTQLGYISGAVPGPELDNRNAGTPAGVGAELTPDLPGGTWGTGQTLDVTFNILLPSIQPFAFFVDALKPDIPTPTSTSVPTATSTNTPIPPTPTHTPIVCADSSGGGGIGGGGAPTRRCPTPTFTPVPPTPTFTPVPPTPTPTSTPTPIPPTPTFTPTNTSIPQASLIINEVDADQISTDAAEFIELFDGGSGNTGLTGLALVLYNGSDNLSYNSFDLDGQSTDGDGYFVLCANAASVPNCDLDVSPDTNLIQNGEDAVVLLVGDAVNYFNDTALPADGDILDAIVYETGSDTNSGLLVLLNAGQGVVDEGGAGNQTDHSNQRCPNGAGGARNTNTYAQGSPTSGAANICGAP